MPTVICVGRSVTISTGCKMGSRTFAIAISCQPFRIQRLRTSQSCAARIGNEYFNGESVIDDVISIVLVMLGGLSQAARFAGTRQQGVLPRYFRREPIEFPTSPRMPPHTIQEFCRGPGLAAVDTHRDVGYLVLARPGHTGNRIDPIGS